MDNNDDGKKESKVELLGEKKNQLGLRSPAIQYILFFTLAKVKSVLQIFKKEMTPMFVSHFTSEQKGNRPLKYDSMFLYDRYQL